MINYIVCCFLVLAVSFTAVAQADVTGDADSTTIQLNGANDAPATVDNTDELLAGQYFRSGDYERAVVLYEELFNKRPTPVIYNNYLICLLELEDYRKAERLVRAQIRQFPDQIRFQVDLGWVMERSGNLRQSRRQLDGLIGDLPSEMRHVTDLAEAFDQRGYSDRVIETYLQGRKLLGSSQPLHLHLAPVYERMGNYRAMMNEYLTYLEENLEQAEQIRGILQDAISNDPHFSRNDALRGMLLGRAQTYPNNTLYPEMLLWLSIQQKDFRMALMQARALDRRFREDGERVIEVARLSSDNQQYEIAAQAYQYIIDKGREATYYMEALTGFLDARFLAITSSYNYEKEELLAVEQDYNNALEELGVNAVTVRLVRNLAKLQAFYLNNTERAIDLLNSTLNIPQVSSRVRAECRIELADILVLTGDVWDATLLYAEVDKTFRDDPLAHEARYKNARLSFYIGEFDWARAQLDVLKAATSRLIANDAMKLSLRIQDNIGFDGNTEALLRYARAEKLIFMNRYDEALASLDSLASLFPAHAIVDDVIFAKAEIFLRQRKYREADTLLARIVEQFPRGLLADEALFKRAVLHEEILNDQETAMSLYQKIMIDYPGSLNNLAARNRFRSLRGDLIN
jgi:tetratricopeptide (TPR) repeat protein